MFCLVRLYFVVAALNESRSILSVYGMSTAWESKRWYLCFTNYMAFRSDIDVRGLILKRSKASNVYFLDKLKELLLIKSVDSLHTSNATSG